MSAAKRVRRPSKRRLLAAKLRANDPFFGMSSKAFKKATTEAEFKITGYQGKKFGGAMKYRRRPPETPLEKFDPESFTGEI